jgi:hypothetical protein
MPVSIRDASLTTVKRQQRALAAFRSSYTGAFPGGFPNGNTVRPEQPNTQTSDVPVNARLGAALLNCCSSATDDGYGKQAPANTRN